MKEASLSSNTKELCKLSKVICRDPTMKMKADTCYFLHSLVISPFLVVKQRKEKLIWSNPWLGSHWYPRCSTVQGICSAPPDHSVQGM